ncbi:MAG: DUF167 domain-containing protein [Allopontixanthobacter sediminis]
MARPRTDLPAADDLRALASEGGHLAVRVTPGARSEAVSIEAGRVLIKVRAQPESGAANDAVLKSLAKALGLPPSRLRMLRGATSRDKIFAIRE